MVNEKVSSCSMCCSDFIEKSLCCCRVSKCRFSSQNKRENNGNRRQKWISDRVKKKVKRELTKNCWNYILMYSHNVWHLRRTIRPFSLNRLCLVRWHNLCGFFNYRDTWVISFMNPAIMLHGAPSEPIQRTCCARTLPTIIYIKDTWTLRQPSMKMNGKYIVRILA